MRSRLTTYTLELLFIFISVSCVIAFDANFSAKPQRGWSPASSVAASHAKHNTPTLPQLFRRSQRWTIDEENRLLNLRGQDLAWDEVQEAFPDQSLAALEARYKSAVEERKQQGPVPWTPTEDEQLLRLVDEKDGEWRSVADELPGREPEAAQRRYERLITIFKPGLRPFTPEEDELLVKLCRWGETWNDIARSFRGRRISTLAHRYKFLTGESKEKRWTAEEDDVLVKAMEGGMTVKQASKLLDGRTIGSVGARVGEFRKSGRLAPKVFKGHFSDTEFELMGKLRKKGESWPEIVRKYFPDRNHGTARNAFKAYMGKKDRLK